MDNRREVQDQQEQQLSLALDDPRETDDPGGLGRREDTSKVIEADQAIAPTFFHRILAALRR